MSMAFNLFLLADVPLLPTVNAVLNGLATLLLLAGIVLIKRKQETAHKWTMLSAFGVSILFLICYVAYHIQIGGGKKFPDGPSPAIRYAYLLMLATHIVLAAAVPFLAGWTIYLGLKNRRPQHRRWAVWTFPIWLYVSITGVLIYAILYHVYAA